MAIAKAHFVHQSSLIQSVGQCFAVLGINKFERLGTAPAFRAANSNAAHRLFHLLLSKYFSHFSSKADLINSFIAHYARS